MTMRRALFPFAALLLASGASPAAAGHWRAHYADWWSIHQAIYERENRIAFLEADPETDDGYRAPIISRHRAEILLVVFGSAFARNLKQGLIAVLSADRYDETAADLQLIFQ